MPPRKKTQEQISPAVPIPTKFEIPPPNTGDLSEILLDSCHFSNSFRFQMLPITLRIDDIIRLFQITVDDIMAHELALSVEGNRPFTDKERVEKIRCDERLERLIEFLDSIGVKQEYLIKYIWQCTEDNKANITKMNAIMGDLREDQANEQVGLASTDAGV